MPLSPAMLAWKNELVLLVDNLRVEHYDLAMARYEGGEYHPNVSTTGVEDAEFLYQKHLEKLETLV